MFTVLLSRAKDRRPTSAGARLIPWINRRRESEGTAHTGSVLIEKHGRGVTVVVARQEYERLTDKPPGRTVIGA